MAVVLETFDGEARWSSHELGQVAVVDPVYFSMTGQATFPFPLGPMERQDAIDCGFELLEGEMTLILLHQRMKVHLMNYPFSLRPSG